MSERRVVRPRRVPEVTFDSPAYWAARPNRHDAHVVAYEGALLAAHFAWIDDEGDAALWLSASEKWQRHVYALLQ